MRRIFHILLIVIAALLFGACSKCETQTEPLLSIYNKTDDINYDFNVYWIENEDTVYLSETGRRLRLPIDRDTMFFYFEHAYNTLETEILAISYKRKFNYQGNKCGAYIELINFELLPTSTVQNVTFEHLLSLSDEYYHNLFQPNQDEYIIRIFDL